MDTTFIKDALTDMVACKMIWSNLVTSFVEVELQDSDARHLSTQILAMLGYANNHDLTAIEDSIRELLRDTYVGQTTLTHMLQGEKTHQTKYVHLLLSEYVKGSRGKTALDILAGDALVTQCLFDDGLDVIGYEPTYLSAPRLSVPVIQNIPRGVEYDVGLFLCSGSYFLSPKAQTSIDNLKIFTDLIKLGGQIVFLETVPISNDPSYSYVAGMSRYIYLKLLQNSKRLITPLCLTTDDWIHLFGKLGFVSESSRIVGSGRLPIAGWYTLTSFRKVE